MKSQQGTAGRRPASVDALRRLKTIKAGQAATAQNVSYISAMGSGVIAISGLS
ncbi:uncharacterized protein PHACADRAFT_203214 [Phanerochaete carnosa HHB-10118-sp]|uniref:Uncharacterized protein n=1 Tax=Phanerochaete carnosa (strain HHB-10118-sp) TaxID=650164 RepID=K5UF96_PHACS|nr:uncharacterized protein PHACADRAFT_203214 [Phanerochaete carnosa HHB-10118-sp]EKM48126.1 hypothetical protein PHACADRAFT_203214 [Phanerochaete carnosa HHB-10118-sp]